MGFRDTLKDANTTGDTSVHEVCEMVADEDSEVPTSCWPYNVADERIIKGILWPQNDPDNINWPHAHWQLENSCVCVEMMKPDSAITNQGNVPQKSTQRPTKTNNHPHNQPCAEKDIDFNHRQQQKHGIWQLCHACVQVTRIDNTHKINADGSVKLKRQLVYMEKYDDTFVSVKPMKANKKVPIIKPAERIEVFNMDVVRDLYVKRSAAVKCNKCGKKYSRKSSLNYHVKDKHEHKTRFQCKVCDRCFLSKSQYTVHVARHNKKKRVECRKCLQKFYCVSDRNKHLRNCFKRPNYKCKICDSKFSSKEGLRTHVLQEVSRRRYVCVSCKKKFLHYSSLYNHMKACED